MLNLNNNADITTTTKHDRVKKKTRSNRFMDDIECHLSKPEQDYIIPVVPVSAVEPVTSNNDALYQNNNNNNNNNDTTSSLTSWLSTTAHSFGITTSSSLHMTKVTNHNMRLDGITAVAPLLSRSKQRTRENTNNSPCENIELVSSTTVLDKTELEQLEQLRLLETPSDGYTNYIYQYVYKIWVHIQNHRREWFIGMTLILCAWIYFNFRDRLIY